MGARSGGGGGTGDTGLERDSTYKGKIENVESLKNIKDPKLYKEMKAAISRFYKELGLKEKNIKLADLDGNVYGIGGPGGIFLNKRYFKNASAKEITEKFKGEYKSGWQTKTNKPVAHVITHEMAHTVWMKGVGDAKHQAAGKEIQKVYNAWKKDGNKTKLGYGKYAGRNVSEFFAETITKAIHGKADKYTKALKGIVKKYKL